MPGELPFIHFFNCLSDLMFRVEPKKTARVRNGSVSYTHLSGHLDQVINHGYLAVDFFFVLSGFVVGYAYDDRWNKMTIGAFFKRRLIRLQPMVVMGMFIGAVFFFFGSDAMFPEIGRVSVWQVMLLFVIGSTLLPVPPSMDIRGWGKCIR